MPIPLWLQCSHLLVATSSRIMHHVTKLKSSQTGFLNMTMSSLYSNGLHNHQISIQESTFGMWWNGRFASWMCSRQICSNCVMLSCQYWPKSLRNVSNTLLNLCHEELWQFWRQKEVQPSTSNVIHSFIHHLKVWGPYFLFLFFVHCFQNKVSYAHQGCIYLSQNMVKQYCEILFY